MEANIIKLDENTLHVVVDNEAQEYQLADWVRPEYIKKGPADISVSEGVVTFVSMKAKDTKKETEEKMGKAPEKKESTGKWEEDMVNFEDLLNAAHEKFEDFSVKTELIENDWLNQRAVFKATIVVNNKKEEFKETIYQAYGDATQDNVGDMVKKHYIRMAETRAIARALRWATNNATCTEEEK